MDLRARRTHTRQDHPEIVRALQARDLPLVQELMSRHIDHHFDHIIELTRLGYAEIYMGNALADYAEARLSNGSTATDTSTFPTNRKTA